MELQQFEYFKVIGKHQSLTRASQELMVSQPSLSNMIGRLEKELNIKLFERKGRNIILTEHGRIFYRYSISITGELSNLKKELIELSNNINCKVSIGTLNAIFLNKWLSEFLLSNPESAVTHIPLRSDILFERLYHGEIDFALTITKPPGSDFEYRYLAQDSCVLLVPEKHSLAERKAIYILEAANERFLALDNPESHSRVIDLISSLAGFQPNIVFQGETGLLERLCAAGNGCFFYMKSTTNEIDMRKIKMIELLDDFAKFDLYLCWNKRNNMNPSCTKFRQFIVDWYKSRLG